MHTYRPSLALAFIFGFVTVAVSSSAASIPIKIATWNIEWLNSHNNTGNVKRTNADYDRLQAYADVLDADVVALQEVDGEDAAKRVFDPSVYAFSFEGRNDAQLAGFAWKKDLAARGVTVTPEPDLYALSLNDSVRRGARILLSTDDAQLRLMAVHLKSGCFDADLDSGSDACSKLAQQVPLLESWIDQQAGADVPFIVLGDFNRRLKPADEVWIELDDSSPANADLSSLNEGKTSSCNGGQFPEFIDHIVFDQQAGGWRDFLSYQLLTYAPADASQFKLSDHCPVAVSVDLPSDGGGGGGGTPPAADTLEGLRQRVERIEQHLGLPPP